MSEDIELVDQRPTVVCAVALNSRARQKLADMLGEARLVDIREPVAMADVVLAPSCSPNTLAALKDAYPTARMIVVELEDPTTRSTSVDRSLDCARRAQTPTSPRTAWKTWPTS